MATQTIEFCAPSGLTLTASIFAAGTDTASQSAVACTERTNKKGFYTFSFVGTLVGQYDLVAKSGSNTVVVDSVILANVTATYQVQSLLGNLDTTVSSRLATSGYSAPDNATISAIAGYVDTEVAAIKTVTDRISGMLVLNGSIYQYTANALALAPAGTTNLTVLPYSGSTPDRVVGTKITVFFNESTTVSIGVTDSSGNAVDVSAKTLRFVVEDRFGNDVLTIPNASITRVTSTVTVTITTAVTSTKTSYKWALRDITSGNTVLCHGVLDVVFAAEVDS